MSDTELDNSPDYDAGYRAGYEAGLASGQAVAEAVEAIPASAFEEPQLALRAAAEGQLIEADAVALDSVILKVTELAQRIEVVEAEVGIKFTG